MRLIDADSAIEVVHKWLDDIFCISSTADEVTVFKKLRALPTVDAAPVRHGRWVKTSGYVTPGGDPVWRCSECGRGIHVYGVEHDTYGRDVAIGQWVACPNCGAKMDEEEENAEKDLR